MPTTTKWSLRYPALTDTPDVPRDIQNLANDLDDVAKFSSGLLSARPTAATAKAGRYYYATDNGVLYLSDGSAWVEVNPKDAAAGTASLRTLGTGAAQASPGNHQHAGAGSGSIALGSGATANGGQAVALGDSTIVNAGHLNSAAIGPSAATTTSNQIRLGKTTTPPTVSIPGDLEVGGAVTFPAYTDAAAGTASLRTLGTGATQAAAGNHRHTNVNDLPFGTMVVQGTLAGTNQVVYYGQVNADGSRHGGSDTWTSLRSATGVYLIGGLSFFNGSPQLQTPVVSIVGLPSTPRFACIEQMPVSSNSFGVRTFTSSGAATDSAFTFMVIGPV